MISKMAIVETENIGSNVKIKEFAIIRAGVQIGNNVTIHPHVVIENNVIIGDNVEIFPGSYIGKIPKGAVLARQPDYRPYIEIKEGCCIGPNAVIYYDVLIGENTLIGDGASIRDKCRIGSNCLISRYVTINYATSIGDRTKILDNTHITGNCTIESDVFISCGVASANDNAIGRLGYDESRIQGPTIKAGAAIGAGAILLPAVVINEGAIVAAGAVVSKDVAANTLVMGSPARFKRFLEAGEV